MINVKKQSHLPVVTLFSNKQSRFLDVPGGGATSSLNIAEGKPAAGSVSIGEIQPNEYTCKLKDFFKSLKEAVSASRRLLSFTSI
ncbi:hypothetical protein [Bacillus daqingensis]|uniref:hypothetical protein n=1 Tax=Bacillus daqingensis TaxID=872396 RepID=UPI003F84167C